MNLISNAHKYSPDHTTITTENQIKGNNLQVAVFDQSIGISVDDQARLLTKFLRVDNEATRPVEDTVLGLLITKGINETSGGTIFLQSEIVQGTRFILTMPTEMPKSVTEIKLASSPTSVAKPFKQPR